MACSNCSPFQRPPVHASQSDTAVAPRQESCWGSLPQPCHERRGVQPWVENMGGDHVMIIHLRDRRQIHEY